LFALSGDYVKSGSAGFALVNHTVITTGVVGTYNLSFTAGTVSTYSVVSMHSNGNPGHQSHLLNFMMGGHYLQFNTPDNWYVNVPVLSVSLVGQVPRSVAVGEEIQFGVQVFDEEGLPAEGRPIVLLAVSVSPGDLENQGVAYVPDYRSDKFGTKTTLTRERRRFSCPTPVLCCLS
jgi:hypothetical protein